jgi:predicted house-cleaning noncanonical NTP pyrophosphatase (MazG superfamily)
MPKFKLNKLVRDKLRDEYARTGQLAVYTDLTPDEYKSKLLEKIVEETREIKINAPIDAITNEISDLRQAIDDLMSAYNISEEKVKFTQQLRSNLKGGFTAGVFVDTLELKDEDPWVDYYRQRPDIFPEEK